MPLEVICAGFGRTGTMSLYTALNQLGYKTYHMKVALETSAIAEWARIANGEVPKDNVHKILEGYTATTDFPTCIYYKELLARNPKAKVVLTVRDAESWYRSVSETILNVGTGCYLLPYVPPYSWVLRHLDDAWIRPVLGGTQAVAVADKANCVRAFNAHVEDVKRHVPADQLLVFEPRQGWAPLCAFLGVPVPATPFPNINDTESFKRMHLYTIIADRVLILAVAAGLGALGYYLFRA